MSRLRADNLTNRAADGAPTAENGLVVTGVTTATAFDGTSGTFSGDVTVGGVLTYQDVTNVDSVGMITARKGIQVLADGINAVGVVTATSFSGDGSNLSGVESGVVNFVASGTIANGDKIIVNTDGTVSTISESNLSSPSGGTPTTFTSSQILFTAATYDSENKKVVVAYNDNNNSGAGNVIIGTVDTVSNSISFGVPVVFESGAANYISLAYDSTNSRVVIAYQDNNNSNYGTAIVGAVSGTTISFGSPVVFLSGTVNYTSVAFDSSNNRIVISYQNVQNGGRGNTIVGNVSGSTISFGTPGVFQSSNVVDIKSTFDSSNNKIVVIFRNSDNLHYGQAVVGTVNSSNNSISFGSPVTFNSSGTYYPSVTFDSSNNKVVIAYRDTGNSEYGTAIVGTVSGTSISFGSKTTFESANTQEIATTFDTSINKVVIAYSDTGNSNYGQAIIGTVSGTSISFGSPSVFQTAYTVRNAITYDSFHNKVVNSYALSVNPTYGGRSVILKTTTSNLSGENYIGMAAEGISNGATGKVNIVGGINTGQTSLTVAKTYYVMEDGTLSTTNNTGIVAGTSVSSTNIIVKG